MKKLVRAQVGSAVGLDCRPRAAPRALCSWKRGEVTVREDGRYWGHRGVAWFPPTFHRDTRLKRQLFYLQDGFAPE